MKTKLNAVVAFAGLLAVGTLSSCTTNVTPSSPTTGTTTTTIQQSNPYIGSTTTERKTTTTQY
ncbi:MAG: hypothetical protein WEB53_03880 [Akkermansiaceae bacterium]